MTLNELLNSDLATIVALLRQAFDWWVGQLRDLVPERLRGNAVASGIFVHASSAGELATGTVPAKHQVVVVPHAAALVRDIAAPPMSRSDARKMVTFGIERYFPVPTAELLTVVASPEVVGGGLSVAAAAVTRTFAISLAASIIRAGLDPERVMIADRLHAGGVDTRFDLLPAMRAAELLPQRTSPAPTLWAVVGFMVLANVGIAVWQDVARTSQMADLVDAQQPAARIATTITGRLKRGEQLVVAADRRRRHGGPLAVLDATTRALPPTAWVQRLTWQDGSLRLAGYRSATSNVVAALKKEPLFSGVRNASGERLAATSNGEPFDVVMATRP